jgi:predicted anti-sigma-YlaC factor YlaD
VRCDQCRDALSARLDGEDDPAERARADEHLADCVECRRWYDAAAEITRLARLSVVSPPVGIDDAVLSAAPGPARRRLATGLRVALGALGAAQFVLGMAQLTVLQPAGHTHGADGGPVGTIGAAAHLWHESAAWNVAIGAGFAWIALRRSRAAALIPVLTAFVGLLILTSVTDLARGWVDLTRLFSHGMVLAGYLIIVALTRPGLDHGSPPADRRPRSAPWSVRFDPEPQPSPVRLRAVPPPHPAARHDHAA